MFFRRLLTALLAATGLIAQWTPVAPTIRPFARAQSATAWSPTTAETYLFGGVDPTSQPATNFRDTWTWNGGTWQQRATSGPPARFGASMAFDAARGQLVLYGGAAASTLGTIDYDDTWEWNGASWARSFTANSPGALLGAPGLGLTAMAYDEAAARIVLYGASSTFEYDGVDWVQQTPAQSPPARSSPTMCSAPTLGGVLLFGGNSPPIHRNDVWRYSALVHTWSDFTPTTGPLPPGRRTAGLAQDGGTGNYTLHGGLVGNLGLSDTWVFDGAAWTDVTPTTGSPAARTFGAFAPAAGGCFVLFGGQDGFGFPLADTWALGPCATSVPYGTGCVGSAGIPTLTATTLPVLGASYDLEATNLVASATAGLVVMGLDDTISSLGPLPLNLAALGFGPSCSLLAGDYSLTLIAANNGAAQVLLPIPAQPVFAGVRLFHQFGSIDAGAAGGLAVSNGVAGTIQ